MSYTYQTLVAKLALLSGQPPFNQQQNLQRWLGGVTANLRGCVTSEGVWNTCFTNNNLIPANCWSSEDGTLNFEALLTAGTHRQGKKLHIKFFILWLIAQEMGWTTYQPTHTCYQNLLKTLAQVEQNLLEYPTYIGSVLN